AVDLAFQGKRIDDRPDVIDDHVRDDLDGPRLRIDLDLAHVTAAWPRILPRHEGPRLVEPRLQARRQPARLEGRAGDIGQGHPTIRPGDPKSPGVEHEVGLGRLEEVRGDALRLGNDLVRREPQGRSADQGRAGAHRPRTEGYLVGVPVDVPYRPGVETEPLVEYLLERGLVTLPLAFRPHEDRRAAARVEPDFRELRLRRRRPLDRVDHSQAPEPPAPTRRLAPGSEPRDVGEPERLVHALLELAGVVGDLEGRAIRHRGGGNEVPPPQLDSIPAELTRGVVDQPLDHVGRLRPARAAVGRRRIDVGAKASDVDVGGTNT